jgi:hypothetical protein
MEKGIFLLSFLNLSVEPLLTKKQMNDLADKIRPIIKDTDCDLIIVDRVCMPIDKNNFKQYLKSLLKEVDKL